jgi:dethiobiotin synthetase/adenosylmethionine--8-amino-7-oxononanoate aminotransferase
MPHLYPNLRISQVFGGMTVQHFDHLGYADETANTEVGKTLLTTALIRATASRYGGETSVSGSSNSQAKRVFYLKPVSTGPDSESDVR